ncbi:mitochondrion protein [Nannochloropsis gaditana]|uniref:Mitochondrion protein n=2 Tax=Nannochloropsis gaditana TaxID=72520 RepID=W7TLU1_9STRA|nr:mitochondrion protein [Nannochloropsis gaditana]
MYAQDQDLRVISALGAGLKADPTRLCIGELDNTKNEPLAIKLRYLLRKQGRACTGITTVYSHEKPRGSLLPLTDEQEAAPSDFGILEHMRLRVLPVLGTMPALFGQAMAAFVLCELAGQSLQPVAVVIPFPIPFLLGRLQMARLLGKMHTLPSGFSLLLLPCLIFLLTLRTPPSTPKALKLLPPPALPPSLPAPQEGLSRNVKHRLLQHLRNRERATFQNRDT